MGTSYLPHRPFFLIPDFKCGLVYKNDLRLRTTCLDLEHVSYQRQVTCRAIAQAKRDLHRPWVILREKKTVEGNCFSKAWLGSTPPSSSGILFNVILVTVTR